MKEQKEVKKLDNDRLQSKIRKLKEKLALAGASLEMAKSAEKKGASQEEIKALTRELTEHQEKLRHEYREMEIVMIKHNGEMQVQKTKLTS